MAEAGSAANARAGVARRSAIVCAYLMLGVGALLVLRHSLGSLVLDPERTLTLTVYTVAGAVILAAAAQPAQYLSRPFGLRLGLRVVGAAWVNVAAAAFVVIDAMIVWAATDLPSEARWLYAFAVPALVTLLIFLTSFGTTPVDADEVSDEDITEAALLLTESQRRWSWRDVFAMAGFMAWTRLAILSAYFLTIIGSVAVFEWLTAAFLSPEPLPLDQATLQDVYAKGLDAGSFILARGITWFIVIFVAILPPLYILSAAAWYRLQLRRERSRLRAMSKTSAMQILTRRELAIWRRNVEQSAAPIRKRAVS